MKCIIFSAARIANYSFIKHIDYADSLIICADAGFLHAESLGITPNLIVGDFDSLEQAPLSDAEIVRHPAEKDDTDTMLALKIALERGATDITIFGGIGDRLDHTYANISALYYAKQHGVNASLKSDSCVVMLCTDKMQASCDDWDYISLLAYGGNCEGVSISGVKYPLTDALLTTDFPLGVSNRFTSEQADIAVKSGCLMIILTKE